jgi:hypothetical protein
LAPGTSAQYAMYQGPSRSTIAVNSLRTTRLYRRRGVAGRPEATPRPRRQNRP